MTEKIERSSMKMSESAGNLGVLIPKIDILIGRMNPSQSFEMKDFFEFWIYCVILGFTQTSGIPNGAAARRQNRHRFQYKSWSNYIIF